MSEYFIRTEQMTVGYDGKPLIKDIEIRMRQGEILTLIGPNGAGKSTILKDSFVLSAEPYTWTVRS